MRSPRALSFLAGLLAIYLVAPFIAGLAQIDVADWTGASLAGLARASVVSIASATVATAFVTLGGVPLGYLLARRPGRGTALLGFVVQLPLALPPLASGVLLLFLFGYASPIGRLTHGALTDSFIGIVLAEAFVAAPFLIIAARSAFADVDPVLEGVAATLGHRPWAAFRKVSLALAWRGIWAGMLLTWLRAFGEFGATVMLAYHPYSLPVYTYVAFGSEGLPAMLPILLPTIAAAIAIMAVSQFALSPRPRRSSISAPADSPALAEGPDTSLPLAGTHPLSLTFRRRLDGFALDIAWRTDARRLCILGASGSGKSLTLRLIAGLDRAEAASLIVDGRDLSSLSPYDREIAYVPQNYGLLPNLTVFDQIRFSVGYDPTRARAWSERLGLAALEHRRPGELSLGQQQRVALARALARDSRLILLDEPFSALDAPLRARLCGQLLTLQQELSATTILVTHDPKEAVMLADDLLLLDDGRVLRSGPVEAVFQRPGSETAARLLGAETIASATVVAPDRIDVGGVELDVAGPDLERGRVGWSVRPHAIRLDAAAGVPASIVMGGPVRAGQRLLSLRVGDALLHAIARPGDIVVPGPCRVSIDPASIQVWPLKQDDLSSNRHPL